MTSALLLSRMQEQEERSADLQRGLDGVDALNTQWREETAEQVRELGSAIQRQLAAWGLTPAEQEIGLLLLKGFSHKEIARFRHTSEVTMRQQATCVYQKVGPRRPCRACPRTSSRSSLLPETAPAAQRRCDRGSVHGLRGGLRSAGLPR